MAEDVSSVVTRRFQNATEPITEISLNDGDGGGGGSGAYAKRENDTCIYSANAICKISASGGRALYRSPPTKREVNYAGT